ncbi:MAG: hypothetical protein ACC653_04325 [Gammaproteobacteria bacterium]
MKTVSKMLLSLLTYGVIACGSSGSGIQISNSSVVLSNNFTGANNASWPSGWTTVSSSATISVDIQNNRGRLRSNSYNGMTSNSALTRVINNTINIQDSDVVFTVEFEDFANQGVGFYVRQNGGYLTDTATNGQGYSVFMEGNGTDDLGLWYELNGIETLLTGSNVPAITILNNTAYKIRFQVQQLNSLDTIQRCKVWLASGTEPAAWSIQFTSSFSALQNISGGVAVDLFNYSGTNSIYLDDIVVTELN